MKPSNMKCNFCKNNVSPNKITFKGFDSTYCSKYCRQQDRAVIIDVDPGYNNHSKWGSKIKKTKSLANITAEWEIECPINTKCEDEEKGLVESEQDSDDEYLFKPNFVSPPPDKPKRCMTGMAFYSIVTSILMTTSVMINVIL